MLVPHDAVVDSVVSELTRRGISYNILCRIFAQKIGQNWHVMPLTDFCSCLQKQGVCKSGENYSLDNMIGDIEAFINSKIQIDGIR